MTSAALLMFNALAAILLAAVLLRAKWCRENLMLALSLVLDAATAGHLGWLTILGQSITSEAALRAMLIGKVLVVYPLLEFAYAFPFGRSPPRAARAIGLGGTALYLALALHPSTAMVADTWAGRAAYFLPFAGATLRVLFGNLREIAATPRSDARGAWAVLAAICYRWISELILFVLIRPVWPDLFAVALLSHGTIGVLGSYVVVAHAVLLHHCLRVRDLVARTVLQTILLAALVAIMVAAEAVVSAHVAHPLLRGLIFGGLAVFIWGGWAVVRRFGPALESAVLRPLDRRRLERKSVLEQTLTESARLTDAKRICALTTNAVATLNDGRVEFCPTVERSDRAAVGARRALPPPLAEALCDPECSLLTREQSYRLPPTGREAFDALGADVLLPVRAQGELLGALALDEIVKPDPEMLETSKLLAGNLASKLLQHALYERAFELQAQLDQSRHLAALGSFAAAIAHDIRTPITSVKMNVELLREQMGDDKDSRECAELALEELGRMTDYVSGILDFVRPVQLSAVDSELSDLIEETARVIQPLLGPLKVQLAWEIPPAATTPTMCVDALRMRQVLVNLVANAAAASAPGASITIMARRCGDDRLAIVVADQGEGIAEADMSRIFDPFFTTRSEGTGLGLAIVKKLVEAHGGTIEAESAPGVGSKFTVTLPLTVAAERAPREAVASQRADSSA